MKNYLILIVITSLLLTSCKENSNYDDKFEIFNELLDRELNLAGWRGTPNSYAEDVKEGRNFHPFQTDELILIMRSDSTYTLIYDPSKSIVGVNQPPKKQNGKYIYRNGQIILDRPFFSSVEASSFDDGEYKSFFLIKEKINVTADSIVELDFRKTSGKFEKYYVTYFILASSMTDNMDDIEDFDEFALEHLNSLELDYNNVTRYVKLLKINKSKQKNYSTNINEEKMIVDNQVNINTDSNGNENEMSSNRVLSNTFSNRAKEFIDKKEYKTIDIGDQTWMAEDLKTVKYNNGDFIFEAKNDAEWEEYGKLKQGCFRIHMNGTFLYNGYAVFDPRGIIPSGFGLPSMDDFEVLYEFLGGYDEAFGAMATYDYNKIEEHPSGGIMDVKVEGTNKSGFGAVPGGFVYDHGVINRYGTCNYWWTSTLNKHSLEHIVTSIGMCSNDIGFKIETLPKSFGFAVRGIK